MLSDSFCRSSATTSAAARGASEAVATSRVPHVVLLSSIGAQHEAGTGPIAGLHLTEALLRAVPTVALTSLRAHCAGRLLCVFGCGGERDVGKRPQMGAIAESLADFLIVTDDNPRGEDGDRIVEQIAAGLQVPQRATVERDRAAAISLAITSARPGDVVLIAGKGHEPYQEVAGMRLPFDDLAIARQVLEGPC